MRHKYTINGKFLTQRITGVQRYANEIVTCLDSLVEKGDIEILVPKDTVIEREYENIPVVPWGIFKGALWEQISYPIYLILHNRMGLNFCSSPLIRPDYAYMHDILFQRNPKYCKPLYFIYTSIIFKNIILRAKKIFTVSYFSKEEILDYYHLKNKDITVISNAWQHMDKIIPDESIYSRKQMITKGEYIFSMSSLSPYKNLKWILENAKQNPNQQYIIAGGINPLLFGDASKDFINLSNVHYIGYVTDEEAKALMIHAKAFLFPSLYEGFGIPPLEALSCGTKIIVSNIPPLREVYGESAHYIDPHNAEVNIDDILSIDVASNRATLLKYNWKKSAKELYDEL